MTIQANYNFPKHHVAIDCVVFGYKDAQLKILLAHRRFQHLQGEWSLLGGWLRENETAEKASRRILNEITGLDDIYLEQVQVFTELERDPGGRVVSIMFYAMVQIEKHDKRLVEKYNAKWWSFKNKPELIFDHDKMVRVAHERLQLKASYELIGQDLLPPKFTILELRNLYEAIFQQSFDASNFRKKILSLDTLKKLKEKNTSDSRKGAYYYTFKAPKKAFIKERIVKDGSNNIGE